MAQGWRRCWRGHLYRSLYWCEKCRADAAARELDGKPPIRIPDKSMGGRGYVIDVDALRRSILANGGPRFDIDTLKKVR